MRLSSSRKNACEPGSSTIGSSTSYDIGFRFHHSRTCCCVTAATLAGLERADGEAGLVHVEVRDLEPFVRAPAAHLVLGLPVRVARRVPVEVQVVVLLEGHLLVPEELGDVPVDE